MLQKSKIKATVKRPENKYYVAESGNSQCHEFENGICCYTSGNLKWTLLTSKKQIGQF